MQVSVILNFPCTAFIFGSRRWRCFGGTLQDIVNALLQWSRPSRLMTPFPFMSSSRCWRILLCHLLFLQIWSRRRSWFQEAQYVSPSVLASQCSSPLLIYQSIVEMALFGSVEAASSVVTSVHTPSSDNIIESYFRQRIRSGWCGRALLQHLLPVGMAVPVIQVAVEAAMTPPTPPLTLRDLSSTHKPMNGMMNCLMVWRGSPPFSMDVTSRSRTSIPYALRMSSTMTWPGIGASIKLQSTRWSMWFHLPLLQFSTIAGPSSWRQWLTGWTRCIKNWPLFKLNIINMKPMITTQNMSIESLSFPTSSVGTMCWKSVKPSTIAKWWFQIDASFGTTGSFKKVAMLFVMGTFYVWQYRHSKKYMRIQQVVFLTV